MVKLLGNLFNHTLWLGKATISPEAPTFPPGTSCPVLKFEVFYDDRVICGFHVVGDGGTVS